MHYRGDIELPDDYELGAFADQSRQIDAISAATPDPDEEASRHVQRGQRSGLFARAQPHLDTQRAQDFPREDHSCWGSFLPTPYRISRFRSSLLWQTNCKDFSAASRRTISPSTRNTLTQEHRSMTAHLSHNTNLVRLRHAVLCANCEVISEANNGHCAACDSEALLTLSRILGGPLGSEVRLDFATPTQMVEDTFRVRFIPTAA
jgi:hypothetical protein